MEALHQYIKTTNLERSITSFFVERKCCGFYPCSRVAPDVLSNFLMTQQRAKRNSAMNKALFRTPYAGHLNGCRSHIR